MIFLKHVIKKGTIEWRPVPELLDLNEIIPMTLSEPMTLITNRFAALVLAAMVAAGSWAPAWAQDGGNEPEAPSAPAVPAPPPASKVDGTSKQVRILRQDDGSLRIIARGEGGENADIQVDLGEEFGGAVTRRIYEKLEEKGILDEQGLVVEEAMDSALESVPRNIDIGISAEMERAHRIAENHRRAHEHEIEQSVRNNDSDEISELNVAIVAILAVFMTPVLIVWLVTRNSYRKKQLMMENINRLVAEGRDIPQELLDAMDETSPAKTKDRGFTLIAVGAAVFIWLSASAGIGVGSLGLIPLFIGVARYINWKLDNQQVNPTV